jgi:hypothetical protein
MSQDKKQIQDDQGLSNRIQKAVNSDIPHLYCNGFVNTVGPGDILIVLEQNSKPIATINTSYTVAKTLVAKLNGLIQNLEVKTGNKIMTTDVIDQTMKN